MPDEHERAGLVSRLSNFSPFSVVSRLFSPSAPAAPPRLFPPPPSSPPYALPEVLIPLEHLVQLLSFGVLCDYLRHAFATIPDRRHVMDPQRPWEGWLESWYRMYDSRLWTMLETDDDADRQAMLDSLALLEVKKSAGAVDQEKIDELEPRVKGLGDRVEERAALLYAMHYSRRYYLAERRAATGLDDAAILSQLPPGFLSLFCPHPHNSVWPVNLPCPSPPLSSFLVLLSPSDSDEKLDRYAPPNIQSPQSLEYSLTHLGYDAHSRVAEAAFLGLGQQFADGDASSRKET